MMPETNHPLRSQHLVVGNKNYIHISAGPYLTVLFGSIRVLNRVTPWHTRSYLGYGRESNPYDYTLIPKKVFFF